MKRIKIIVPFPFDEEGVANRRAQLPDEFIRPEFSVDFVPVKNSCAFGDGYYDAVINWVKRRHGWEIKKEWIMFSPGVVPAINMLVRALTQPGDKVIVQTPGYYPFFAAIQNHGTRI